MDSLPFSAAVASVAVVIIAAVPPRHRAMTGLLILLVTDYSRELHQFQGPVSSSEVNYLSIGINGGVTAYFILFGAHTIKRLLTRPFVIVTLFWVAYLFSSVFSVLLYGVEAKLAILVALKVFAFLSVVVNLTSLRQPYMYVWATVAVGLLDMILASTGWVGSVVLLGTRDLGYVPWVRIDAVWFAAALLWAYVGLGPTSRRPAPSTGSDFRVPTKPFIVGLLVIVIAYGITTTQLRALALESVIGLFVATLALGKHAAPRRLALYAVLVGLVAAVFWQLSDSEMRLSAAEGLLGRDDGGRLELWTYSIDFWLNSPIVGHGLGTDGLFLKSVALAGRQGSHSVYLVLAIETGLLGLAAWLYVNLRGLILEFSAIRSAQLTSDHQALVVMHILHVTMLFHVLFHAVVYFPWTIMIPALSLSLLSRPGELNSRLSISVPRREPRRICPVHSAGNPPG